MNELEFRGPYLLKRENIPQFPAATWENPWEFPLAATWGPILLYWVQSNSVLPIKQVRSLDLLDVTTESPPKHPHTSRSTLMSLPECEIAQCSLNQLKIMPDSPALAPEQFPVPHHTWQVAWLPLDNYRGSLRHTHQVYRNTNFSTGTWGNLHAPHIISEESWFPGFYWRGRRTFHKHFKRSLPSAIGMWEGSWVFCHCW